jgi:hypothetical protein
MEIRVLIKEVGEVLIIIVSGKSRTKKQKDFGSGSEEEERYDALA